MTNKKDRRCENCARYNVNCRKPTRTIPRYATECIQWSEVPQKPSKCKLCKGRGLVQPSRDVRSLQECPACNGKGVLNCSFVTITEFSNTEVVEFVDE